MRASRLPQAWRSGQGQGAGGLGSPKKGHVGLCTLVFPNWSRYCRNSSTWAPPHTAIDSGGRWFRRYWQNVFQSRRFWFSYLLGVVVVLLLLPLPLLLLEQVTIGDATLSIVEIWCFLIWISLGSWG